VDSHTCSRLLKKYWSAIVGVLIAAGMYLYGIKRNQGFIPGWFDNALSLAWGVAIIFGLYVVLRRNDHRFFDVPDRETFRLGPGEISVFSGSFMSCSFYGDAGKFMPRPTLLSWLGFGSPALRISCLLWVRLTDVRLAFGRLPFQTWRVIPLSSVVRVAEVQRAGLYPDVSVVEYQYGEGTEAIVVGTRSAKSRLFIQRLRERIGRDDPDAV